MRIVIILVVLFHQLLELNCFVDFYFDFGLEMAHIDEVSDGKHRVVKQVVKCTGEVQVLGQIWVKSLVPVGRRAIHADEAFKRAQIMRQGERLQCHPIIIQSVPAAVAQCTPQLLSVFALNRM